MKGIKFKNEDNFKPDNIKKLFNIQINSYSCSTLDNSFTVFKSINNILYLIFSSINQSIICYNLEKFQIISEIKNCHNQFISNFKHYLDKENKRDLIISISFNDNNIRVWDISNWECILNLININNEGWTYSACLINKNNQNYIISSNYNSSGFSEPMKIFDFFGEKINEIKNSNKITYFVEIYYDEKLSKNFIVTGNRGFVNSYDYDKNELYYKYCDNDEMSHTSIIIKNTDKMTELIESCFDGNIRIWNFHNGQLINKIKINNEYLYGICLWKNNYLYVGCEDGFIKLIDLEKGIIVKSIIGNGDEMLTIKNIIHPYFGNCLISQTSGINQIEIRLLNC